MTPRSDYPPPMQGLTRRVTLPGGHAMAVETDAAVKTSRDAWALRKAGRACYLGRYFTCSRCKRKMLECEQMGVTFWWNQEQHAWGETVGPAHAAPTGTPQGKVVCVECNDRAHHAAWLKKESKQAQATGGER